MEKELIKPSIVATYILGVASAVAAQQEPKRASRLLGVLGAQCEALQVVLPPLCHPLYVFTQAALHAQLGEEACAATWAEGRLMMLEQALEWAE